MFCRKTFYSKIENMHRKTLNMIHGIDDSYNNLYYAVTILSSWKAPSIFSDKDI